MPDLLKCALGELKRRWLRTVVNLAGYFFAGTFMVMIVLILKFDMQAKNATVNYMGNKFLAYVPLVMTDNNDDQPLPLDRQNEGFFTEPTVATRLLSAGLAAKMLEIPEVDAATPFLLYRFRNSQDGHIFSLGGIKPEDRHALRGTLVTKNDIIRGAFFRKEDRNVVVVDASYAEIWNLKVGSVVNVGGVLYPVIGIVGSYARVARADVYMNWPDAQAIIGRRLNRQLNNEANIFLVEAVGAERTEFAMQKVSKLLQRGLTSAAICSLPAVKFMGLSHSVVKPVLMIVAILILLFSVSSQWSVVSERRHEFAILKAIGWSDRSIFSQIILESVLVAFGGVLFGAMTGYLAFIAVVAAMAQRINAAYVTVNAPVVIVAVLFAAVAAGIISGLGPALKAVKTGPAEVLRTL